MTKMQEAAAAIYALNPVGVRSWADAPTDTVAECMAHVRAVISTLRRPDMNAVMRVAGETKMRPTDVDLAVTGYLDAILKEPQ